MRCRVGLSVCLLAGVVGVLGLVACSERPGSDGGSGGGQTAVVSIPPLAGLLGPVLEAAGLEVEMLVPPGTSAHGYEAPPSKLAALRTAPVIACVGLGLEGSLTRQIEQREQSGITVLRFADLVGIDAEAHEHDHTGHDHDHDHAGADPHLWLDPVLVATYVRAATERLAVSHPERAAPITSAGASVVGRIESVHARYAAALAPYRGRTLVVAHNAYQRLADRYGLRVVALAGLEGGEPTPGAIAEAARVIREATGGSVAVFVEPQTDPSVARRLAEATGASVLTLDPLGGDDWFAMMNANLNALVEGFGGTPPAPSDSPG